MILHRRQFHKSVGTVFFIHPEHHSDKNCRRHRAEYDARSLIDSDGVHYDEKDEDAEQTAHEQKEILRAQPLEFDRFPDPSIDIEFQHTAT